MYYLIILVLALILALCFIDFKGIIIDKILLIIMFLLFAYVKSNVDMGAYLNWYDQINSLGDIALTDPAFGFLMLIGKKFGLSYFEFLGFLGITGLLFLFIVFRRYSKCFSVVLALYFILDFPAEVIQIRAFIAEIVMYILMMEYIGDLYIENFNKNNWKRLGILLLLGILFHSANAFYFLLFIPILLKNRNKLIMVVLIGCILVPSASLILQFIPIPILQEKLQYYFINARSELGFTALMYVLLYLGITMFIYRLAQKTTDYVDWKKLDRLIEIHIISMIACVLLLYFSSNFYRILRAIMVVDSMVIGNYCVDSGKAKAVNCLLLAVGVFMFFIAFELFTHSLYSVMETNSIFQRLLGIE